MLARHALKDQIIKLFGMALAGFRIQLLQQQLNALGFMAAPGFRHAVHNLPQQQRGHVKQRAHLQRGHFRNHGAAARENLNQRGAL